MFISFGYLTKKSLLFIAVPIIIYIRRLLVESITFKNANNMFYCDFIQSLGKSLNGILWLIVEMRTAPKKIEKQDNKNKVSTIPDQNNIQQIDLLCKDEYKNECAYNQCKSDHDKKTKKNNRKKIFLLILVCILNFFSVTSDTVVKKTALSEGRTVCLISLTVVIRLFAIAILSHFIIKNMKLYKHHYLSIAIILIVIIVIHIISYFISNFDDYFPKLGLMILPELLFSIMYVFGAKYLSITKGNIYKLLFINGIIGMILSILLQLFSYNFLPCVINNNDGKDNYTSIDNSTFIDDTFYCDKKKKLKTMLKNFEYVEFKVGFSLLIILANFFETWFIWDLIFNFSVNHFGAVHIIPLYFHFLMLIFIKSDNECFDAKNYTLLILGGVIIIFMTFIYNEIIILKFCGLDKNTAIEINKRALREITCSFGEDKDEIYSKINDNYVIMQEDIERVTDDTKKNYELSTINT